MKKITTLLKAALLLTAIASATNVKAQMANGMMAEPNPWRIGIGVEGGIPVGVLHNLFNAEAGGTLRLQYDVNARYAFTLTSGYYNLFAKSSASPTTNFGEFTYATTPHDLGIVPIKVGVKDFFVPHLYVGLESGIGFEMKYDTDKKLILSPSLGYASKSIDVGVRYEYFGGQGNDYNFVALRLAYGFAF